MTWPQHLSIHLEDAYGYALRLDRKHCTDEEARLMVDGHEFYITPEHRMVIVDALTQAESTSDIRREPIMTDTPPRVAVQPGSRLDDLLAVYADLKPQVDELEKRLKTLTDAIKAELMNAAPGAERVDVAHAALVQPLRLSYVETWRLDSKTLKADDPETYVRYAVKGGSWQLRAVSA